MQSMLGEVLAARSQSNETSHYCVECSEDTRRMFLCPMIRASEGNTKTCFDIWHQGWRCKVLATATNTIQLSQTSGARKRKRARRQLSEFKEMKEDMEERESSDDFMD